MLARLLEEERHSGYRTENMSSHAAVTSARRIPSFAFKERCRAVAASSGRTAAAGVAHPSSAGCSTLAAPPRGELRALDHEQPLSMCRRVQASGAHCLACG
jgi:hypothetical protein